ncbi:MAG TPA: transposase [Candidatus Nanoarchaeia archaeon]|nr:transposase [Candidatus Nanoarchaeia archaeon]
MQQEHTDQRRIRGLQLAQTTRIIQTQQGDWNVPSSSGKGYYVVKSKGIGAECNCPDYELRKSKCKHIWAVELIVTEEVDREGNMTITQTQRITYKQDWKNYNLAQTQEKQYFMKLLADVTNRIPNPPYTFGRPTNPLSDMVYSMVFKVYSTFSGRRFNTDMEMATEHNYVSKRIPYNSMFDYFKKKELTPILVHLVTLTSLPLRSVEKDFTIDSTGFGTSQFQRWFSFKHGKQINSRKWVKCHFMCGVKTNIITSVKITSEFEQDCPQLQELYNTTKEHFDMQELSADKAYLSRNNLETLEDEGTKVFIPFKSNSVPNKKGMTWKRLYHFFMLHNDEFLEHYHKRSNAETTVFMIKSKFGDCVRSKTWTAQVNESLCKVIAHNIYCVIMEMHCLGIKAEFDLKVN